MSVCFSSNYFRRLGFGSRKYPPRPLMVGQCPEIVDSLVKLPVFAGFYGKFNEFLTLPMVGALSVTV